MTTLEDPLVDAVEVSSASKVHPDDFFECFSVELLVNEKEATFEGEVPALLFSEPS